MGILLIIDVYGAYWYKNVKNKRENYGKKFAPRLNNFVRFKMNSLFRTPHFVLKMSFFQTSFSVPQNVHFSNVNLCSASTRIANVVSQLMNIGLWSSSTVWPDWAIFERSWRQIFLRKLPKYLGLFSKSLLFSNTAFHIWGTILKNLSHFFHHLVTLDSAVLCDHDHKNYWLTWLFG